MAAQVVSRKNGLSVSHDSASDSGIASHTTADSIITPGSCSDDFITLDDSEQFTLSTNGEESPTAETDGKNDVPEELVNIPKYTTVFTDFLTVQEFSMETGQPVRDARPKRTCFNCLGDHNVHECPEPLNHSKIAQNRRAHQGKRQISSVRYHEMASNKYGHFTPGVLSPALRHALGCRNYQQSEIVYRMRLLGYSPGWLMEAREQQGELVLYGSDGRAVTMLDGEEGEVTGNAKYRPEKLIDYPGFNSPLPDQFQEEGHLYNLPGIQSKHCVHRWREIMNLNKVTPYRKRKMRPNDTDNTVSSTDITREILVESSSGSNTPEPQVGDRAPAQPTVRVSKRPMNESPEEGEVSSDDESSQSLSKRRKLSEDQSSASLNAIPSTRRKKHNTTVDLTEDSTQELVMVDSSQSNLQFTIDLEPSSMDEDSALESTDQVPQSKDKNSSRSLIKSDRLELMVADEDADADPGPPDSTSTPATAGGRTRSHVHAPSKGFVLGAVLPKSITPFDCLPHADKWTVDVTDHILFDNLPDALGTWNNMKALMKKVKTQVSELHAQED